MGLIGDLTSVPNDTGVGVLTGELQDDESVGVNDRAKVLADLESDALFWHNDFASPFLLHAHWAMLVQAHRLNRFQPMIPMEKLIAVFSTVSIVASALMLILDASLGPATLPLDAANGTASNSTASNSDDRIPW